MSCSKNENIMFMHDCVDVKTQAHNFVAAKIDTHYIAARRTVTSRLYTQTKNMKQKNLAERIIHIHTFLA